MFVSTDGTFNHMIKINRDSINLYGLSNSSYTKDYSRFYTSSLCGLLLELGGVSIPYLGSSSNLSASGIKHLYWTGTILFAGGISFQIYGIHSLRLGIIKQSATQY